MSMDERYAQCETLEELIETHNSFMAFIEKVNATRKTPSPFTEACKKAFEKHYARLSAK